MSGSVNMRRLPLLAVVWLAVTILCCWIYWPGLDGPAIFDDGQNLAVLDVLEESPSQALDVIFGNGSGPTGRPVSMLSFVLEKLYLDKGTWGQKRSNLFLHAVSGSLLALLFYVLFSYRQYRGAVPLSVLLAAYWLLNPLFVSTVLYSIQRMAMLSTLFMFASLLAYSVWRIRWQRGHAGWWILPLLPVLLGLAIFSKENGVVVLPILVLLEVFWFQFVGRDGTRNRAFQFSAYSLIGLGVAVLALGYARYPDWISVGYLLRPFTLIERVITQGWILWDYIFQLLAPNVEKMGVYHDDVAVLTSLTHSSEAMMAWVVWTAILLGVLSAWWFKLGRCAAFAVLFYWLGHSVESTVLALELYFEHRNYFPAAGILLLIGVFLGSVFTALPALKNAVLAFMACYVLVVGLKTSSQAQIWSSDELMRITTVNAHPRSPRANINMAVLLARYGGLDEAYIYSQRAAELRQERLGDLDVRNILLACYANQHLSRESVDALPIWSARGRIIASTNAFHFLVKKFDADQCPALDKTYIANKFATILLGADAPASVTAEVYAGLAILENSLQRYRNAYEYSVLLLALNPNNVRGMLMQLHFATALMEKEAAELVRMQLLRLDEAGLLSVGERQTLSLYTEK